MIKYDVWHGKDLLGCVWFEKTAKKLMQELDNIRIVEYEKHDDGIYYPTERLIDLF